MQAVISKDWNTIEFILEITAGDELPQPIKDALTAAKWPLKRPVNLNTIGSAMGNLKQVISHIRKVLKEGAEAQDYKKHLGEIKTLMQNVYKDINKNR